MEVVVCGMLDPSIIIHNVSPVAYIDASGSASKPSATIENQTKVPQHLFNLLEVVPQSCMTTNSTSVSEPPKTPIDKSAASPVDKQVKEDKSTRSCVCR